MQHTQTWQQGLQLSLLLLLYLLLFLLLIQLLCAAYISTAFFTAAALGCAPTEQQCVCCIQPRPRLFVRWCSFCVWSRFMVQMVRICVSLHACHTSVILVSVLTAARLMLCVLLLLLLLVWLWLLLLCAVLWVTGWWELCANRVTV